MFLLLLFFSALILFTLRSSISESLFTFFAPLTKIFAFHSPIKLLKLTLWISKGHNNFSENLSPIYRIISEKLFFKTPKLYKEWMGSLTTLPPSNFAVFTALSFVVACKELKIAQAAQINQIFQFNRELKQRRRWRQRERQKGNRLD